MKKHDNSKMNLSYIFLGLLTTLALKLNLDVIQGNNMEEIFPNIFLENIIIDIILFIALCFFYQKAYFYGKHILKNKKITVLISLNAMLFALFTIFGYSFYKQNSWDMLFCNKIQISKSIFFIVGYWILFFYALLFVYTVLEKKRFESNKANLQLIKMQNFYLKWLEKYPFRTAMISLIIVYIPYIIASYPGIFTGDTFDLVYQGYNIPTYSSQSRPLINENVILNAHHPVAHTMLLHYCIVLGKTIFHSYNVGVFICSLLQFIFMIVVISLFVKMLIYMEFSAKTCLLFIIYFAISPRLQNYMFLLSKDVMYVACVMLNLLMFYKLMKKNKNKKYYIGFIASSIGILLFRNDGKYMLLLTLAVAIILLKQRRKLFVILFLGALVFNGLYNNILLPSLQITPGSKAEMLSIPFQQTARYKRDYPNDATEDEKKAISAILDYDHLQERYVPSMSDRVKGSFNQRATKEQLKNYFRAWFQQFCRHPGVYIEATFNNLFEYVSPYSNNAIVYSYKNISQRMIDLEKEKCNKYGMDFSFPSKLTTYRNNFEQFREWLFSLPVLELLLKPFIYVWIVIVWFLYCIRLRDKQAILMCVPLLVQGLICIAAPSNGTYFRYLYPIAMCLPIVIMSGWNEIKSNTSDKETI